MKEVTIEIGREVNVRKWVYPKLVFSGKLSEREAAKRLELMRLAEGLVYLYLLRHPAECIELTSQSWLAAHPGEPPSLDAQIQTPSFLVRGLLKPPSDTPIKGGG